MKRIKLFASALVLSLSSVFVLASPTTFAASITWDGSESGDVTDGDNWVGGVAPGESDIAVFPANVSQREIEIPSAVEWAGISFTGTATSDSNYTFDGTGPLTITGGIVNEMTGSAAKHQTFDVPLVFDGTQTVDDGGSLLYFDGTVNLASGTITFNADNTIVVTGVISGGGNITKTGDGELTLEGANTYTGSTVVNEGFLIVEHATALGTTASGTTVADGASIVFLQAEGDITYAEPLTLEGSGANDFTPTVLVTTVWNKGGLSTPPYPTSTFSGAITLESNIKVGATYRDAKLTGAITGNYTISITDDSTGSLILASSSNGSATKNGTIEPAVEETKY
ncbi:autotransporter-associated beta strand repeat-containing protein, partial [Candidatus Saccharibacteria bacterium]|nr:autotransporter-associated beta strand repeat-containing protein [Candidatus Saccharibacteria bacterium]